jgi:uncharacterized damage-inducible protein DinB
MDSLRRDLRNLLKGGQAHVTLEQALDGLSPADRHRRPTASGTALKSVWELLEHLRLAQRDILDYTRDQTWASPPWPEGYWPDPESYSDAAWDETLAGFQADLGALLEWLDSPALDLLAPLPAGEGRTYLRQFLLVADHNSYHVGQIVQVRRLLGSW